jgi:hypothetical protein
MWLRASLSDQPAPSANGSGPASGYILGETEDYLLPGNPWTVYLPITLGSGEPPPPSPEGVHIDESEPLEVQASWPQVPQGDGVASISQDSLALVLHSTAALPKSVQVKLELIANGSKHTLSLPPVILDPGVTLTLGVPITDTLIVPANLRSPAYLVGEARVENLLLAGRAPGVDSSYYFAEVEEIAFHADTTARGKIVVYREGGLQAQLRDMTFVNNPGLSSRLAALIPPDLDKTYLTELVLYDPDDPILVETPVDPNPDELPPPTNAPAAAGSFGFYICPEWYTAPVDNGFGEDYGLQDTGWRARGARVRVWQNGDYIFDSWLNRYGCAYLTTNSTAGFLIWFTGEVRLESGGGYINIKHLSTNSDTSLATTSVWIDSAQAGAVYRPEIQYRDALGALSYAVQERFNGGVSGVWFYLKKAGCGNDPSKGSCSSSLNGDPIIFMSSGQWRRKFIVGHEYGHKILSFIADYKNDCSYGTSGHGMKGPEYGSCASMEGWGHFVSVDIWNESHTGSDNPSGIIVYWDGNDTVYNAETGADQAYCYTYFYTFTCDSLGFELDWMRQWWDYHTNNLPTDPGSPPSHADLFNLVDDAAWSNGVFNASQEIEDQLSGAMQDRWHIYACYNGVVRSGCN